MEQRAIRRAVEDEPSIGQVVALAIALWCFSSFILAVVAVCAVVSFLTWFVTTPVLAAIAATRRWRRG